VDHDDGHHLAVSAPVKVTASGDWRAVYKGDQTALKATSAPDQVTLTR